MQACACAQFRHSLCLSHAERMEVKEDSNQDLYFCGICQLWAYIGGFCAFVISSKISCSGSNWDWMHENLSLGFANNKGTDQIAHLLSLISTFVICLGHP